MPEPRVWIVMLRDLSDTVRVAGEPTLSGAMVLDAGTGLILGVAMLPSGHDALADALERALTGPPAPLPEGPPDIVVCADRIAAEIGTCLTALLPGRDAPTVQPGDAFPEAEDIFDAMIGHLSGREQPDHPPDPDGWRFAFDAAHEYLLQAPWERWSDTVPLTLHVETPDGPGTYLAVVLGSEGVQRGLVLYPGMTMPDGLDGWEPGQPVPIPDGSLMLFLDPPEELPAELVARAARHGWPDRTDVVAVFMRMGSGGAVDVSRTDAHHLCLAATAVVAHDRRGPVVVGAGSTTTGTSTLGTGDTGSYSVAIAPPGDGPRHAVDDDVVAPARLGDATSIGALLDAFLAEQRDRVAVRTFHNYEMVVELLRDCLNGYGYQSLDEDELRRWEAASDADEDAFVHLFGADKIVDNLDEFLGWFMVRKVAAGETLLRSAGTVTEKLAGWLADNDHLPADDAREVAERGAAAARDLPRAEKLSGLLYEQARRAVVDPDALAAGDYVEDLLAIERVEPGRLWFEGGVGPVAVSEASSALACVGWTLSATLARVAGRWQLVSIGNVYP